MKEATVMTPEQRRAWDRARTTFARATEGMTEDEISEHIRRVIREVRQERAAMRRGYSLR